jgi:hypothetical protein
VETATSAHNERLTKNWVKVAQKAAERSETVPGAPLSLSEGDFLALAVEMTPSPSIVRDTRRHVQSVFNRALAAFVIVWEEVRQSTL